MSCWTWPCRANCTIQRCWKQQSRRMLADPRSESLVTNFAEQWLYLRDLKIRTPRDAGFRRQSAACLPRETEMFFGSMLREDRSVLDLLNADYTFVNETSCATLRHSERVGQPFPPRHLHEDDRAAGLLGQGSFLLVTSVTQPDFPVARGKWILENLLGSAPASAAAQRAGSGSEARAARKPPPSASRWNCIAPTRSARRATRSWTPSASRSKISI